jgi:hypothetical protein
MIHTTRNTYRIGQVVTHAGTEYVALREVPKGITIYDLRFWRKVSAPVPVEDDEPEDDINPLSEISPFAADALESAFDTVTLPDAPMDPPPDFTPGGGDSGGGGVSGDW